MRDFGLKANNRVKVGIKHLMDKRNQVFGIGEREKNGWKIQMKILNLKVGMSILILNQKIFKQNIEY